MPSLIIYQVKLRSTNRAGNRFGVEAPVKRVKILFLALGAHIEKTHCGSFAVVGDLLDNGVAGAAFGAVDKWIKKAPVPRIKKLLAAFSADGEVWQDINALGTGFSGAFDN